MNQEARIAANQKVTRLRKIYDDLSDAKLRCGDGDLVSSLLQDAKQSLKDAIVHIQKKADDVSR